MRIRRSGLAPPIRALRRPTRAAAAAVAANTRSGGGGRRRRRSWRCVSVVQGSLDDKRE